MPIQAALPQEPPVVLIIAGFDPCAGAGIATDLFAVASQGAYGIAAITSIVSQSSRKVHHTQALSVSDLDSQIDCLLAEYEISAVKIGLLPNAELTKYVAQKLASLPQQQLPIVLDPVMVASAGKQLMHENALSTLTQELLPLTTLLTPNIPEAQLLSQTPLPADQSTDELDVWCLALRQQLGCDLLLKGGHLEGKFLTDRLVTSSGLTHFSAPKISSPASHGTGCRLSSAIAAQLALGENLSKAIEQARQLVRQNLQQSLCLPSPSTSQHQPHQHLGIPQA